MTLVEELRQLAARLEHIATAPAFPLDAVKRLGDTASIFAKVCESYKKKSASLPDEEAEQIIAKNGGQDWKTTSTGQYPCQWSKGDSSDECGAYLQSGTLVVWGIGGREALATLKEYADQQNHLSAQTKAQQATSGL